MFLARKITRAKWEPGNGVSAEEISADAATADLRTQDNSLFFRKCETNSTKNVEKIELVWVDYDKLKEDGQMLENTSGQTPIADFVNQHFDVCKLDNLKEKVQAEVKKLL